MYDRILIPLDGSEASEAAIAFARHLACERIRLLRVEPNDHLLIPPALTGVEPDWKERYGERIRAELETVAGTLRAQGLPVEVEVRFGDAAAEIIASAEDADLIVMTTHGRGAAGRAIFGSTADRVARYGTVPTLLLRRGAHTTEELIPSRVVVPLDGSALAGLALPEAEKLARILDAPLHLVRAVDLDHVLATVPEAAAINAPALSEQGDLYEQARRETERLAGAYLQEKATSLQDSGLTVDTEVLKGTPAFVLLWMIKRDDVVVMTTHGRSGYRRWVIGSVAEKLVREAAGPVLLVRDATRAGQTPGASEAV